MTSRSKALAEDPHPRQKRDRTSLEAGRDQLLVEMLDLFLPEAREWLHQIEAALLKLEANSATHEAKASLHAIRSAVTNLGGSAATVGMPTVEQLAYALLPHVGTLERQGRRPDPSQCAALRAAFVEVKTALELLLPEDSATGDEAAPAPMTPADAAQTPGLRNEAAGQGGPNAALSDVARSRLLAALEDLQESRAQCSQDTRETLDVLTKTIRGDGNRGGAIDVAAVLRCLDELAAQDDLVMAEAREQMPGIARVLAWLKSGFATTEDLRQILRNMIHLRQAAHDSGAASVVRLLDGLEKFLAIADRHRSSIPGDRFAAVEDQLSQLLPMVQGWIALSRAKREAIEHVLRPRQPRPGNVRTRLTPI